MFIEIFNLILSKFKEVSPINQAEHFYCIFDQASMSIKYLFQKHKQNNPSFDSYSGQPIVHHTLLSLLQVNLLK